MACNAGLLALYDKFVATKGFLAYPCPPCQRPIGSGLNLYCLMGLSASCSKSECKPRFVAPAISQITYFAHYRPTKHRQEVTQYRRDGRVVEGARLESVYTATYRGFESLSLRHQPFR